MATITRDHKIQSTNLFFSRVQPIPDIKMANTGVYIHVFIIPLWHLGGTDVLAWGIYVAHHKMLSDLLHVFIVEEGVEAQLVCSEKESETKTYCVDIRWYRMIVMFYTVFVVLHGTSTTLIHCFPRFHWISFRNSIHYTHS